MNVAPSTKQKKKPLPVSQAARHFSDHIRIEERSIALHRAVAERIRGNPKLMEEGIINLQRYLQQSFSDSRKPVSSLVECQELL